MTITIALSTLAAGCIQVPEDANAETFEPASAPTQDERINGMSATVDEQDTLIACPDRGDPLVPLPRSCAQRIVTAEGRIGLDELPVQLTGSNGAVIVEHSDGDAWSFQAIVAVESLTEDMAREALDSAWTWSHEDPEGGHALRAGPTVTEGMVVTMGVSPTSQVVSTEYLVRLPAWLTLDLKAITDNGQIIVRGFDMTSVDLETDNGEIVLSGAAGNVRLHTDNGGVSGSLTPRHSGTWDLKTDNGQIVLAMPENARTGYDIEAKVDNGQVVIGLTDGETRHGEDRVTFTSRGYDQRAVQVKIGAQVDNGQIVHGGA